MKKNTMMRIASTLLIAVLLTTCAIGATMAKYTVNNTVTDSARVAKWGVAVTVGTTGENADTDVFDTTYATTDTNYSTSITASVSSANSTDAIVAPGTSGSLTFTITGTPEVATKVTFAVDTATTKDISIPSNTTVGATALTTAYNPVKFSLTKNGSAVDGATNISLSDMLSKIDGLDSTYETNSTTLAATYVLSWNWDFDDTTTSGANDAYDTYLANVAAGSITDSTVCTEIAFSFTITVDQID